RPATCGRARPSSSRRPWERGLLRRSRSGGTWTSGIAAETLDGCARARVTVAEAVLDPREIFELIVKADERLKYATSDKAALRRRQARELLERAGTRPARSGTRPLWPRPS